MEKPKCELLSICGYDFCCIYCPKNENCNIRCTGQDSVEYAEECPFCVKTETEKLNTDIKKRVY